MLSFRIEGLPPSYNKHFNINYNFKECYLSPEAHAFKNRVKINMPYSDLKEVPLCIRISYTYNWFTKNRKLRKFDSSNCDKLLLDALAEGLGIDDSWFKERHMTDIHSEDNEFTLVNIEPI